ncbi:MAG: hypothetical protein ACRCX2_30190 [Paraclostridium sp.]
MDTTSIVNAYKSEFDKLTLDMKQITQQIMDDIELQALQLAPHASGALKKSVVNDTDGDEYTVGFGRYDAIATNRDGEPPYTYAIEVHDEPQAFRKTGNELFLQIPAYENFVSAESRYEGD